MSSTHDREALRRLLYCGEWIESHALHIYLLHAPDFLGYDGAVEMAERPSADRRTGPSAQEGRKPDPRAGRRPSDPSGQRRVGGFYRSRQAGAGAPGRTVAPGAATRRSRRCVGRRVRVPRLRARARDRRAHDTETYAIERGRLISSAGLDLAPQSSRKPSSRNRCRTRPRSMPGSATGAVPRRPARPLQPQRRPALAAGAGGGEGGGPRAGVPQPVSQHRGAERRGAVRVRRGAAPHRRVRDARPVGGRGRATTGHRLRMDRGATRGALPPLRARCRRDHPFGADRAADLAESGQRSKTTCASSCRSVWSSTTRRSRTTASRRFVTTIRASRAPPTSLISRS